MGHHISTLSDLLKEDAVEHLTRVLDVNFLENHLSPVLFVWIQAGEKNCT